MEPWPKILVAGGRDFNYKSIVWDLLDYAMIPYCCRESLVITGGARGVDTLANQWAIERGCETKVVAANWNQHGKKAGWIRNNEMADLEPNLVILFPGGVGTKMMKDIAEKRKFKVIDYAN